MIRIAVAPDRVARPPDRLTALAAAGVRVWVDPAAAPVWRLWRSAASDSSDGPCRPGPGAEADVCLVDGGRSGRLAEVRRDLTAAGRPSRLDPGLCPPPPPGPGPLGGLTVMATRPAEDLRRDLPAYGALGARTVPWPLSRRAPLPWSAVARQVADAPDPVAVAVTSAAAAAVAVRLAAWRGGDREGPPLAAVGVATADALRRLGATAVRVAERQDGEGLADLVAGLVPPGAVVYLVRAAGGLVSTPAALRDRGLAPWCVDAYAVEEETAFDAVASAALAAGRPVALLFMSPGAATRAAARLGTAALGTAVRFAAGPTTAARLHDLGLAPHAVAPSADAASLRRRVVAWWRGLD